MNINEIGAKTCHCCEGEAPMSMDSRTIKDNIRETTEQLHIIEGMLDGTKTIVSCGEGDDNDPYAWFCAAVTKRVFGSTSQAKKVLARTRKETSK